MPPYRISAPAPGIALCLAAWFLAGCGLVARARPQCPAGQEVCVIAHCASFDCQVTAKNGKSNPVTVHVDLKTDNLLYDRKQGPLFTIGPKKTRILYRLRSWDLAGGGRLDVRYAWTDGSFEAVPDTGCVYDLPYAQNAAYPISQGYNGKATHVGKYRYSLDFAMPVGTPIRAAREGVVIERQDGNDTACFEDRCEKFANYVTILHADGTKSHYGNLRKHGVVPAVGDSVARGQIIGYSGNTGKSQGPHLHFMVTRFAGTDTVATIPTRFRVRKGAAETLMEGVEYRAP